MYTTGTGSQWAGQVVFKTDPSGAAAPLPHYAQHGLICVQFNSQARVGASTAATWSSLTFAHNYVQGERLSLPPALLRMGNFPEAPANNGV